MPPMHTPRPLLSPCKRSIWFKYHPNLPLRARWVDTDVLDLCPIVLFHPLDDFPRLPPPHSPVPIQLLHTPKHTNPRQHTFLVRPKSTGLDAVCVGSRGGECLTDRVVLVTVVFFECVFFGSFGVKLPNPCRHHNIPHTRPNQPYAHVRVLITAYLTPLDLIFAVVLTNQEIWLFFHPQTPQTP
jgi:hypothetical protein